MSEIEQLQAENITLLKELSALKIQLFMERQKNAKAMEQALKYLQDNQRLIADNERHAYVMEYNAFIERFEQTIAGAEQPAQQEPDPDALTIAYVSGLYEGKKRKPLTDKQIFDLAEEYEEIPYGAGMKRLRFARAIEAAHGITKGTP